MTDPTQPPPAPLRVLVVESDDRIRESLTRLLPIGGRCLVVGSAGQPEGALALAESIRPDIVMLDCRLAEECVGQDLIACLRAVDPGVRIVVLSLADPSEPPELRGADAYIRKTFRPHELIDAVLNAD